MLSFWIAVAGAVAAVVGAMAYYALKARAHARPSRGVEVTSLPPQPVERLVEMPRPLGRDTRDTPDTDTRDPDTRPWELDARPRGFDDEQVRTGRAGRQAR